MKLKSIEEEAKACRKAFEKTSIGDFVLHCHHEILGESLREPAKNRIAYILADKPQYEQALRLHLFRPASKAKLIALGRKDPRIKKAYADWQKAYADYQKAVADWQKAYADYEKAYADYQKAYADWQKAYADYEKADADRQKAYADRQKAVADWQKAVADRQKAVADWQKAVADRQKAYADYEKAYADYQKADADWQKADAELAILVHPHVCKNCPWDGSTIFPKVKEGL